ncbi:hypothetical protein EUGRSUZ_G02871 [Eucalyptus grandis]|uniref:Uncharacterized protein n=2 Tax=Eucalyptus grandis TaxID=71139 RepID=A0ACC3K7B1_EUCGR|nr:hypothetical protein EUGRSUZ_G02871 [Eucalyptus grandis]
MDYVSFSSKCNHLQYMQREKSPTHQQTQPPNFNPQRHKLLHTASSSVIPSSQCTKHTISSSNIILTRHQVSVQSLTIPGKPRNRGLQPIA